MPETQPDFIKTQLAFTAHIRSPDKHKRPVDVEDRRMKIYRELFYNNVEGFVSGTFPVIRQLYNDDDWHRMVRDFFERHRCKTPYFLEISEEFLDYLQHEREAQPEDPPGLRELAHYEWVELALSVSEENIDMTGIDPNGDVLTHHPVMSPVAWPLAYQYPVHQMGPDFLPDEAPANPTYLVVFRDRNDDVQFMEINPVTARLLQLLSENESLTGQQALLQIAEELQATDTDMIINAGTQAMHELQQQGVLIGVRV